VATATRSLSLDDARVLRRVEGLVDEAVALLQALVRIPTVNPPGEGYAAFAEAITEAYRRFGYATQQLVAADHPDHVPTAPRVNVWARREGASTGPTVHFNGHLDVVPAGQGWTVDPFGGLLRDGKVFGRGTCDMKAGLVASLFAVEALSREGVILAGAIEQSATVDEESGGFAGVAWLAEKGYFSPEKQHHLIITEPLDPDRVCLGHRGAYWFDVVAEGRTAHGSMPFLGDNAIDRLVRFLTAFDRELRPQIEARRTDAPVAPPGARRGTLNLAAIRGGQSPDEPQSPCVPDRCVAVFDRRVLPDESLEGAIAEISAFAADFPGISVRDRLRISPSLTSADTAVVKALDEAIAAVQGRPGSHVVSPGSYDQKHLVRLANLHSAVAYGPGRLDLAHQPDEHVAVDDLRAAMGAMALAVLRLQRTR
jgi:succinyl-diaminopimelate desuccinylase